MILPLFPLLVLVHLRLCIAQSLSDLPQCGQTCISNMISIATSQFGCGDGDVNCYCCKANFGYGIRDCANQDCPTQSDVADTLSYGVSYCSNAQCSGTSSGAATNSSSTGAVASAASASESAQSSTVNSTTSSSTGMVPGSATSSSQGGTAANGAETGPASASAAASNATGTSNSLSTGAKAGIGVGAVVGVAVLVSLGVFLFVLGRRRGRNLATKGRAEEAPYTDHKDAAEVFERPEKQEIDGLTRHELHHPGSELHSSEKSEMPAAHGRSELPGS